MSAKLVERGSYGRTATCATRGTEDVAVYDGMSINGPAITFRPLIGETVVTACAVRRTATTTKQRSKSTETVRSYPTAGSRDVDVGDNDAAKGQVGTAKVTAAPSYAHAAITVAGVYDC